MALGPKKRTKCKPLQNLHKILHAKLVCQHMVNCVQTKMQQIYASEIINTT